MNSSDFKKITRELLKKLVNIEHTECVICQEEIKVGTLLLPCVHYQYCIECFSKSVSNECPLCREEIQHIVNYYKKTEYCRDITSIAKAINYNPG